MLPLIGSLARSICYCIRIAWNASKIYTIIRIFSNILIPLISIASTYLVKRILDVLVTEEETSFRIVIVLLLLMLFLTCISLLIQRAVGHAQTVTVKSPGV